MPFRELKLFTLSFPFMTEDDFNLITPGLEYVDFAAKDHFCRAGIVNRRLGFVVHGAFRTYKIVGSKEVNTEFSFESHSLGDYESIATHKPSNLSVQALEPSRVISINCEVLFKAYDLSPNWMRLGRYMLEMALFQRGERLDDFLLLDSQQRYLHLLEKYPQVFERVPLYHIASYLGMEKESLSRLRALIRRSGGI